MLVLSCATDLYHYFHQEGYVFAFVCLSVCISAG